MFRDIRLPIGLLFAIAGVIVAIVGFAANGVELNKSSFCIYISAWSGIGLIVFGAIMLFMAFYAQKKVKSPTQAKPQQ